MKNQKHLLSIDKPFTLSWELDLVPNAQHQEPWNSTSALDLLADGMQTHIILTLIMHHVDASQLPT
jgi:hypothetical protein